MRQTLVTVVMTGNAILEEASWLMPNSKRQLWIILHPNNLVLVSNSDGDITAFRVSEYS